MVSRTESDIDGLFIGGNTFAEVSQGEGTESTILTGVVIVLTITGRKPASQRKTKGRTSKMT